MNRDNTIPMIGLVIVMALILALFWLIPYALGLK